MISVCLATYNGKSYIIEQLDSILVQLSYNDEVIISDDNSTDETLSLVRSVNDARIKIFTNNLGQGYTRNFENAIMNSSGDFIFLCDQDDVWMENKVSVMMNALKTADLVVSDALICDGLLNPTLGSHFKLHSTRTGFIHNLVMTRYIGACMAFKKEILTRVLPFPTNSKLCAHDYWIANVGELYYKVELVDIPLIRYRRHGLNASNGGEKSKSSLLHKIKVRIYTIFNLLKRI